MVFQKMFLLLPCPDTSNRISIGRPTPWRWIMWLSSTVFYPLCSARWDKTLSVIGKNMKILEKREVKLQPDAYEALIRKRMVASACNDLLASPHKRSGYLLLKGRSPKDNWKISRDRWRRKRTTQRRTEGGEALGDVCEHLESVLFGIRMRKTR